MSVSIEIKELATKRLLEIAQAAPAAQNKAVAAALSLISRAEARQIQAIYGRPIPTKADQAKYTATGKVSRRIGDASSSQPMWVRSGDLLAGLTAEVTDGQAILGIAGPAAVYAKWRESIGADWTPKNPALGIVRRNAFARDAMYQTLLGGKQLRETIRNAVARELKI
jgi:hypothetical protein